MKLIGNLKDKVEKADSTESARKIIAEAGMELTANELDKVVGGIVNNPYGQKAPITIPDTPKPETPPEPQIIQR